MQSIPKNPYAGITFIKRQATIHDKDGKEVFNELVEFPDYFDDSSVKIVSSKYLCNTSKRKESSLKDMIDRVSDTIAGWGLTQKYFDTEEEKIEFANKLKYYQIRQYFAFNSPVYFNVGISDEPQGSACFILEVNDDMNSITDWYKTEAMIFKGGSGAGANLSKLRSSRERVRGGGTASGPVSFLKSSDTIASVIKSGGTFRRSAKLACLNIDHPDINLFIKCKDKEEQKLRILKSAGVVAEDGYELSDEVYFQNTNISVRLTNEFMKAVYANKKFSTKEVLTGRVVDTFDARDMLMNIAKHAWETGDPGIQYHDNTNDWNPVPTDGKIEASNPCAEFLFLNNSSCNLASLNLKKFFDSEFNFNHERFVDLVKTVITAQDILVDAVTYPTPEITKNSTKYRPLGLGFSNLGALCMYLGYPYDSEEARAVASYLTLYMTGVAYETSRNLALKVGVPKFWNKNNKISMYEVLYKHYEAINDLPDLDNGHNLLEIKKKGKAVWEQVIATDDPIRNAQVTLLAPTGTISFMMGCDTTGIEPDFSLVKYKRLTGNDGATIKTINNTIKEALVNLGYSQQTTTKIISDLVDFDIPIEKSKYIQKEHIPIFDCAMSSANGSRCIDYKGHVKMMVAVQPFISGAISKTINMPNDCTVQDVYDLFCYASDEGLKSITIYRDGSKTDQVMTVTDGKAVNLVHTFESIRKSLPADRKGATHKFTINGMVEGYLTHNTFEDGKLAEFFVTIAKDGSTLRGLIDAMATQSSIALQYGVPLEALVDKMINRKFEPSGFTKNEEIRTCSSIIDYIFKFLALSYLDKDTCEELGIYSTNNKPKSSGDMRSKTKVGLNISTNPCPKCGQLMRRLGSCEFCDECGYNGGACG